MTGKRLVKRDRPRWLPFAAAGIVALVVIALAGGGVLLKQHRSQVEQAAVKQKEADRASACSEQLDPVYDALVAVDGQMTTGANISQFTEIVGAASAAQNAVDADIVEENRCEMYAPLTEIVSMYGLISQGWNDCLFDYDYCDVDTDIDVESGLNDVSVNLDSLGTDMSLDYDASDFAINSDLIEAEVTYGEGLDS